MPGTDPITATPCNQHSRPEMPVVCSHGNRQRLEPFFEDRQVIVLKDGNVEADRFANIVDRFLSG